MTEPIQEHLEETRTNPKPKPKKAWRNGNGWVLPLSPKRQAIRDRADAKKKTHKAEMQARRKARRAERKAARKRKYDAKWARKHRRELRKKAKLSRQAKWRQNMERLWASRAESREDSRLTKDFAQGQIAGIHVAEQSRAFQEGFCLGFELTAERICALLGEKP